VVVRTPPDVSLYHRHGNPHFADVLARLAGEPEARVVVLPRTTEQRDAIRGELPSVVVPEQVIDAQSLVALADLVVSAGGTMNREAAVLGTPVWSIFEGRLGAVDAQLVREGRLQFLHDPAEIDVRKKPPERWQERVRRDPADLLRLALPWPSP
jgi:predicted glycosyltransferase